MTGKWVGCQGGVVWRRGGNRGENGAERGKGCERGVTGG